MRIVNFYCSQGEIANAVYLRCIAIVCVASGSGLILSVAYATWRKVAEHSVRCIRSCCLCTLVRPCAVCIIHLPRQSFPNANNFEDRRIAARNRVDGLLNFLHQTRINFQNPSATPPSPNLLAMSLRAAFAQGPVRLHLRLGRSNRNQVAAERP